MNIGLIRMRYSPYGGAEIFLSRFIEELFKRGHKCHIFAARWDEDTVVGGKGQGASSELVLHKVKTFGPAFLRILSFAISAYFAVRKANLDIILGFDRTFYQDIYRAGDGCHREWLKQRMLAEARSQNQGKIFASFLFPLKRYITAINPLHRTILYLEKRVFRSKRLRFVIANSNRGKEEIQRHYGLPGEKIYVIYNGIDINKFNRQDKKSIRLAIREGLGVKDEIVLLFVGAGFERKGLKFLIEALGILKREGHKRLKLIVVGKGKIKEYKCVADKHGVDTDIRFIGPARDVNSYYYAADIFVLPSIYEPFSNACLEAMASSLPVVTSAINGASEVITCGRDGMIVDDPLNPDEIAEAIKPLLDDAVRLEMGRMARINAENYTIQKNVDNFLSLVERIK